MPHVIVRIILDESVATQVPSPACDPLFPSSPMDGGIRRKRQRGTCAVAVASALGDASSTHQLGVSRNATSVGARQQKAQVAKALQGRGRVHRAVSANASTQMSV